MDLTSLNQAIDAAFAVALANPQRIAPQTVAPNVTLQTDTYVSPKGGGFRVVCRIIVPEANFSVSRVKNHGPDTQSEQDWPSEGIEAAAQAHVARCIAAGENHVTQAGFNADRKVILLNKLLKVKEANALAEHPKLAALYGWMESVQSKAVAGLLNFAKPPHTFEEVIAE